MRTITTTETRISWRKPPTYNVFIKALVQAVWRYVLELEYWCLKPGFPFQINVLFLLDTRFLLQVPAKTAW